MIYRIKQFIPAISAKMTVEDIEFVKSYLSKTYLVYLNNINIKTGSVG